MTYTFGHPQISVKGEGPTQTEEAKTFAKNLVVGNDELGNYQVALNYDEPIAEGRETDLVFSVSTATDEMTELEPFLGENMHLVIIKDDLATFIHAHPIRNISSNGASPEGRAFVPVVYANGDDEHDTESADEDHEGISFHVTFLEPGVYKAFAQFRPKDAELSEDETLTTGFWIRVDPSVAVGVEEEKVISKSAQWWGLLITSLILMTLLSLGVRKYLIVQKVPAKDVEAKKETPPEKTEKSTENEPEKST
jgi:hypothetical protein